MALPIFVKGIPFSTCLFHYYLREMEARTQSPTGSLVLPRREQWRETARETSETEMMGDGGYEAESSVIPEPSSRAIGNAPEQLQLEWQSKALSAEHQALTSTEVATANTLWKKLFPDRQLP